jgi:hypothetical protein
MPYTSNINVPAIFKSICTKLNVNFKCDSYMKVMEQILSDKQVDAKKNLVYPLVILIHDFEEKYNSKDFDFDLSPLSILICNLSTPTFYAEQRYAKNVLPILNPIYLGLLNEIVNSKYFSGNQFVKHTKKIDLNTGTSAGKEAYYLPDYLDGIWIKDLELKVNYQRCANLHTDTTNGIKIYS